MTTKADTEHTWKDEISDLLRGVGGAALIGVPLIYTREVWDIAVTFNTISILFLFVFGFIINIGCNLFSGFRKGGGLREATANAGEALAIGMLFSAILLGVLGIIDREDSLIQIIKVIAVETIPLAIGVSIANTQFDGGESDRSAEEESDSTDTDKDHNRRTLREIGTAAAGSLIFAASIAPTEELAILSHNLSPGRLALLALFSLILSYAMIFVADFTGSQNRRQEPGILQSPLGETILAYAIALIISATTIYYFHGIAVTNSPQSTIALIATLGLPATIGGAAGRLII